MKKLLLLTIALVIASVANAGQRDYAKLDSNTDNLVSLEEFLIHVKSQGIEDMTKEFHRRDKNKDGMLTQDEYTLKKK